MIFHVFCSSPDVFCREDLATGYDLFSKTSGDLNNDSLEDVVEIYFKKPEATFLKITLSEESSPSKKLVILAPKAVCVGCGGAKSSWGEPLGVYSIKGQQLIFHAAGGSRGLWEMELRWQFEKNKKDFILATGFLSQVDTAEKKAPTVVIEIDYLKKHGSKKILTKNNKIMKCPFPKKFAQIRLSEFDFESFDFEEACPFTTK